MQVERIKKKNLDGQTDSAEGETGSYGVERVTRASVPVCSRWKPGQPKGGDSFPILFEIAKKSDRKEEITNPVCVFVCLGLEGVFAATIVRRKNI